MTKRSIGIERLFSLGDFRNIKFVDTIVDIPEEVANNEKVIQALTLIQLARIEKSYFQYLKMLETTSKMVNRDEVIEYLASYSDEIYSKLFELIKKQETFEEKEKQEKSENKEK